MSWGTIEQPAFGKRLRELRRQHGWSQRQLARGIVNPSYISLLESGARVPTLQVAMGLARALEVSAHDLIGSMVMTSNPVAEDPYAALITGILVRRAGESGNLASALAHLEQSFQLASEQHQVTAAIAYGLAAQDLLADMGRVLDGYWLLMELTELAAECESVEVRLTVAGARARAAYQTNRVSEAVTTAETSLALIEGTQLAHTEEHWKFLTLLLLIQTEHDAADHIAVLRLVSQVLELAKKIDSPAVTARSHWLVGIGLARSGQSELALLHIRSAIKSFGVPGTTLGEWVRFCRTAVGVLLDVGADLAEVGRLIRSARMVLTLVELPGETAPMRVLDARYAWATGQVRRALKMSESVPALLDDDDLAQLRLVHARALRWLGEHSAAAEEFRELAAFCELRSLPHLAKEARRGLSDCVVSAEVRAECG